MPIDSRTTNRNNVPPVSKVTIKKGWVELPLDKLVKAPWNYKKNDKRKAAALTANIRRNGQVQNIIVRDLGDGKFEICNGNHRLDSFEDLKFRTAMTYNLGCCSLAAAKRVAIETNETNFDTDQKLLAGLIYDLGFSDVAEYDLSDLLETMPFDDNDMRQMVDSLGSNMNTFSECDDNNFGQGKVGGEDEKEEDGVPGGQKAHPDWKTRVITCPYCNKEISLKDE